MQKFEFFKSDSITVHGQYRAYRIRALRDFGFVKKGEIGGYIQYASNLSQEGNCWVNENSAGFGNVRITDDAYVKDSIITGFVRVRGYSVVSCSRISGYADIHNSVVRNSHIRSIVPGAFLVERSEIGEIYLAGNKETYHFIKMNNENGRKNLIELFPENFI